MGDKSELQININLKVRHAENIVKVLNENGVKFSGVKMGTVAAIAIKKSDVSKYEAAVEKVKAGYKKAEIPSAKPLSVTVEIDKAISENNFELYRYDMDKAVDSVIQKCGVEKTSKFLADYINYYSYDGRISAKNKAWAKGFESTKDRYGPVFKTHPAVLDGFIESFRDKIKSIEIQSLPSLYDDKFLYSSERVELRDDYRGIPETNYYNSSANEYFVEGIGWLDDSAYDREQKMSGLSVKDFYAKVTHINADYVDTLGSVGQMDMSKSDYNLLTEKTYSPENAEKLKAAKAALQERKTAAGITDNPVEYYAVRQTNDHKFAVCTISADGLVTPVKPNLGTVAEAQKAMLELFEKKKNSVKCEFIHPQNLDEKSAELGRKPDFSNYDKIYEGDMSTVNALGDTVGDKLEAVFVKFNLDRPEDFKGHSLSVSDVVVMDDKAYYVDTIGFQPLKEFKPIEKIFRRKRRRTFQNRRSRSLSKKPKL